MFKAKVTSIPKERPKLKNALHLICFAIFLNAPALAQSTQTDTPEPSQDSEKTLGEVIVEGQVFKDLPPLPKGNIVFSPELITRVNGEGSRAALHNYYELVFDPVIVNDDGFLQPDPDPRRKRETLRPQLAEKRPRTGSHIKRVPPSFYKLTLEEGFYALTQVNYRIQTKIPIIFDPTEAGAVIDAELERSLEDFQYCLAKGTLLFDVEKDKTATFSRIMFRGLGRDKEERPTHVPIAAAEDPTTRPADGYIFAKDPDPVSWGAGYFDAESGMCQRGEHFVVSGWKMSDSWRW